MKLNFEVFKIQDFSILQSWLYRKIICFFIKNIAYFSVHFVKDYLNQVNLICA